MDKKTGAIIILSIVAGMLSLFVGLMLFFSVMEKAEKRNPPITITQEINENSYEVGGFDTLTDKEIKRVNKFFKDLTADSENVNVYYSKEYQALICHSDLTFNDLIVGYETGSLEDLIENMCEAAKGSADIAEQMFNKEVDRGVLITVEGEPYLLALESCGVISFE